MAINLGTVKPGSTIVIPFNTFDSNDPSASVAIAAFIAGDIEVYKDGVATTRASDNGYTLLDTDGIDFDSHVGIGGFSIDLADNSDAGFWAAGSRYFVVVGPTTVDAGVINFIAATFEVGYSDAILNTTIASLTSATQFILTDGPAEADVFIGSRVILHDVASKVQVAFGIVSNYIVTTKEVFLVATPVGFTPVATDNISLFMPNDVHSVRGTVQTAGDIAALINALNDLSAANVATELETYDGPTRAEATSDKDEIITDLDDVKGTGFVKDTDSLVDIRPETDKIALADAGAGVGNSLIEEVLNIDQSAMRGTDGVDTATMRGTDGVDTGTHVALVNLIWNELISEARTAASYGQRLKDSVGLDTFLAASVQAIDDWIDAGRLDAILDLIKTEVDKITLVTAGAGVTGSLAEIILNIDTAAMRGTDSAALASEVTSARMSELDDSAGKLVAVADLIKTAVDAIKLETDKITLVDAGAGVSGSVIEEIENRPTTAMRGTDSAALASVATEARLAELDAGNLPTDIAAIPTTAMRGTDSVVLAGPTKAEMDAAHALLATPSDILTTALTESYAANGVAPTLSQIMFACHQYLMSFGISGTAYTVRKLNDSDTAFVVTLDDSANPTDAKRV